MSITWDNVSFKDSMAFLPFPLATFPKTFGLTQMKKGFYPFLLDTLWNQAYRDPIPNTDMFYPDGMSTSRREEFKTWYDTLTMTQIVFNLQDELSDYCASDVKLLKEG